MSLHIARMNRTMDDIHSQLRSTKDVLRHELAMAKYQARREMDLRIAQKVMFYKQKPKESALAGYIIVLQTVAVAAFFVILSL